MAARALLTDVNRLVEDILKFTILFTTTTAAVLGFTNAAADTTNDAARSDDTEIISVIGSRGPATDLAIPAAIQVISQADIARSGAQTVVQVLASIGGLQINDSIGNRGRGSSISLRGFGENGVNNVLVLVDGRKLNNPSLAGPDLSSIALPHVSRIEILHGSAGALYGDQAAAGVINIITRSATNDNEPVRTELAAGRGNNNSERYQLALHGRFDSGWHYRVGSEKRLSDNFRDNNAERYRNDSGQLGYTGEQWDLRIDAQQTDDQLRLPGSLTAEQFHDDPRQTQTPNDFGNRDTDAWRMGARYSLNEQWQFLLDLHDRDEQGDGALFASPYRYRTQVQSVQPRLQAQFGTSTWLLGIDADDSDASTDYGFGLTRIDQQTDDVYSQLSLPLDETWSLTATGRHSRFEGDHNVAQKVTQSLNAWQLGAGFRVNTQQRLFARVDTAFRWPTADENGFISPTQTALDPQRSQSWELGWSRHTEAFQTELTLYRIALKDEIFYDPSATGPFGPGTGANINLDDSERRGLTVRGKWQTSDILHVHFNASATDARFQSGQYDDNTVPLVAKRQAGLGLNWQISEALGFSIDGQYSGERYLAGDNDNSSRALGGYTLFNFAARWQAAPWQVTVRIDNASDKRYAGFAGASTFGPAYYYPAAGRQAELLVGVSF